ncbi:MAG: hypothetical protein MZW92_56545 [Comamonadaceae bacterium]|nr:hypothetical protein [Comamonadaceae bacterium]
MPRRAARALTEPLLRDAGATARSAPTCSTSRADPGWSAADDAPGVRYRADHWLLVDERPHRRRAGATRPGDDWQRARPHAAACCMPGFVDTHVHMPQLDVIASYGTELLDWLNTYTFPAERALRRPRGRARAAPTASSTRCSRTAPPPRWCFPTVHTGVGRRAVRRGRGARHARDRRQGA